METHDKINDDIVNLWIALAVIIVSFLFFHCVNVLSRSKLPKSIEPNTENSWRWANHFVSMAHGLFAGVWVVICFIIYPDMKYNLLYHTTNSTVLVLCTSTGYFIYDMVDMMINNKLLKLYEVTLHHIFVIAVLGYNIYNTIFIGVCCVAIVAEVNSILLHGRKLMQLAKYRFDDKLYRIVCHINLWSFLLCRWIPIAIIDMYILSYPELQTTFYFCLAGFCMALVTIINIILFWRLLKNDILRHPTKVVANGNNNITYKDGNGLKSD